MKKHIALVILFLEITTGSFAQELPLILDHPGTFEILNRIDYAMADCGFAKAEMTTNLQKINELVGVIRKNPVLSEPKGFDGRARIYNAVN